MTQNKTTVGDVRMAKTMALMLRQFADALDSNPETVSVTKMELSRGEGKGPFGGPNGMHIIGIEFSATISERIADTTEKG